MTVYTFQKTLDTHAPQTPKVKAVAEMFGLGTDAQRKLTILPTCQIQIDPGQVVYITGGSGAGKSILLHMIREQLLGCIDLKDIDLPLATPVVDCLEGSLTDSLNWLSLAGLSEAFAMLRTPAQLSDGQRYRLRLAMAMSQKPAAICIDEFCNPLDRITAAVVAHNVRKFADRYGTTFVVATSHDDLLDDLRPDVVAVKLYGGGCEVYYPGGIQKEPPMNADERWR